MLKKILSIIGVSLVLSGCGPAAKTGSSTPAPPLPGSIYKSFDSGRSFVPKITIDEKRHITSADILSWAFQPNDPNTMYIGTASDGIFRTRDGAEHWEKLTYPPERVYGIAIDPSNPDRIFATGVYEKIAKIYRTEDAGVNWKEMYVEPGAGTVISALALHPSDPNTLYAATDKGIVIKSIDGGMQWKNIYQAGAPVTKILLGLKNPESVSILAFQKEVIHSENGGLSWNDFSKDPLHAVTSPEGTSLSTPITLADDPSAPNVLYAGSTSGMYRSTDSGKTWNAMNIIESAKQYPIRSIAINPNNPNEIVFASGAVLYRSTDAGLSWSVTELGISKGVSVIVYEPGNPEVIYFGIRSFK